MREFRDGAAVIVGEEAGAAGGAGSEAANAQVGIQKDRGDVGAGDEIVQILVRFAEFLDFRLVLVVEGLQLLVDAFQFLVRALEFLVGGLQLLVRGLEFLVGGFQFLHGGLQPAAAVAEFLLEFADALHAFVQADRVGLIGAEFFHVLEKNEQVDPVVLRGADGFHGDRDVAHGLIRFAGDRAETAGLLLAEHARRDSAEGGGDACREEFCKVHARAALLEADMAADVAEAVEDFQAAVHHEAGLIDPAQDAVGENLEQARRGIVRESRPGHRREVAGVKA